MRKPSWSSHGRDDAGPDRRESSHQILLRTSGRILDTRTVNELGWSGIKNGELLKRLEGEFDVFVTADKNIRYQQSLTNRSFAIVEIFTNRLPKLREWSKAILEGIRSISGNEYVQVRPESGSRGR